MYHQDYDHEESNYDDMTPEDEIRIITNLANNLGVNGILSQYPEVYGILREELNNEMLEEWENEQADGPVPFQAGKDYRGTDFEQYDTTTFGPFTEGKYTLTIDIDQITYTFLLVGYIPAQGGVYRCVYVG